MKGYVYAISLLMCGLGYFAAQVATRVIELPPEMRPLKRTCKWENLYIAEGTHHMGGGVCRQLICDSTGKVIMKTCPEANCPDGEYLYSYTFPDYTKRFPDCCAQFVCRKRGPVNLARLDDLAIDVFYRGYIPDDE
ncbi:uncharacterized protein LOC114255382 [Monomorium pharaonis]|uniref:uncharacterized protein LOC114255382 n=1 Tax=Monomorium pharaonis TaxID=307658 RepID=UPI00102E1738|nr:uncharacterized protein LOC114255382 [Monomorium pharaonis]